MLVYSKHAGRLAGVALMSLGIMALAIGAAEAQTQTTLRLGTYVNENDIRYERLEKFGELVDEKTDGRVEVQIFGSGTLFPFAKAIPSVLGGVADLAPITMAPVDKRLLPCAHVTQMMPAAVDWERIIELDTKYNALLKDEFAEAGLVTLFSSNASYDQEWFFSSPIDDLDELEGLLIRSPGSAVTEVIKRWGGRPVFIAPSEMYQAAERGVIDGLNMGVATFSSWKMWDVMPYMVNANMFYNNIMYIMSKKKFDALSPQDQAALMEAGRESSVWLKPRYVSWIDEQVDAAIKNGATVRTLSEAETLQLVENARKGWDAKMKKACGAKLAAKLQALFEEYQR